MGGIRGGKVTGVIGYLVAEGQQLLQNREAMSPPVPQPSSTNSSLSVKQKTNGELCTDAGTHLWALG